MNVSKRITGVLLLLLGFPTAVYAHKFDIAVVAAYSSSGHQMAEALWQGMRVATRERDGHSFETSDGHLGGVDSNLLRLDVQWDDSFLAKRFKEIGSPQGFLIVVLAPGIRALDGIIPDDIPHVLMPVGDISLSTLSQLSPERMPAVSEAEFHQRYLELYHQSPPAEALSGYLAARLIDLAIRSAEGDITHSLGAQQALLEKLASATSPE